MFNQSKILIWYQVASQKVFLGEALSDEHQDVISMWLNAPEELTPRESLGYRLSLFDDDGRQIGDKPVSMMTADEFLSGIRLQM